MNKMKNSLDFPIILRACFISSIPKKKKSPLSLDGERGIFLVNKLRNFLMKLIYNSYFQVVEDNLTDSNIGTRKKKAPRDHLFVVSSKLNDVIHGKWKKAIDVVFYDVRQCFDSLWTDKTLLDLYRNRIKYNTLNLIHEANKETIISIKTPVDISQKQMIKTHLLKDEMFECSFLTGFLYSFLENTLRHLFDILKG